MQFTHYDLGHQSGGEVVEITLVGSAANVRLLDSSNFQRYRNGREHRYVGGLAQKSPVRLQIPHSGTWYVVVDMQGLRGSVRSSMRIMPRALPPIRQVPLGSVPSLLRTMETSQSSEDGVSPQTFDVFISHASEDKDEVVRPLAESLRAGGLDVWYDEFELRIGDSLRRKIDLGLARSRFGIVVLSQAFFGKGWTNYELDGLVTRSINGEQILLPIWHNITKQQLISYSPSLADKVARNTVSNTIQEIADEILAVIQGVIE